MRVGAWCWQDGGRRLRVAGCLDAHGTAFLVEDAKKREPPREVIAPDLALTGGGVSAVRGALPGLAPPASATRAVHDIRNSLAVLRLRLQMLPSAGAAPGEAVGTALRNLDELNAAVDRLATPR